MKIKKLEFETSKGRFVVVDTHGRDNYYKTLRSIMPNEEYIGLLNELTEEQASDIVYVEFSFEVDEETSETKRWEKSAIDSLHSLIKSKGWYLENPRQSTKPIDDLSFYDSQEDMEKCLSTWQQAESRTLHNPVIFKIASDKV